MNSIDDRALDSLSVAPEEQDAGSSRTERQDAGQDKSITKRLQKNPDSADARLDNGLDETMDASDPVSISEPGDSGEPAPSSGYDEDADKGR
ncbi:MAG: hypothetical protein EOP68_17145 [Sphingomonas sp.]|jgi:hypothetical protein|nr:MAG: hypothetical protein EOP68_17145 [Sphingomonas sp.]